MVLEHQRAGRFAELALELVEHQLAVEMHGDASLFEFDFKVIPLARWLVGDLQRLVVLRIDAAGSHALVVPDFHLRLAAQEDAAVAAFGDLPVNQEEEVAEFLFTGEVLGLSVVRQDPAVGLPVVRPGRPSSRSCPGR